MAPSGDGAVDVDTSFGERLRRYREGATLTQEELAERAGLTAMAVSALERGERRRPYPNTVRALANGLGLDDQQRAELAAAVPRRSEARGAVDLTNATTEVLTSLPPQPTALLGRDGELALV